MKLNLRVFQIIEKAETGDKASKIFDYFIITLIILNVTAVILESYNMLAIRYHIFFKYFEIISVVIFSVEYLLRISTSDLKYSDISKLNARFKFIFSFIALIDLFAILPFYLPMIIVIDLRFLRILRLTRILRVLKIQRYNNSLNLIGKIINNKKEDLIVTFFVTFLLLILASSIMYYIETNSQPELFPNIIAAFWWAIATLTTIGYGDVYPVTVLGKILSGIIALLGIGIVALPTAIISSGFIELMQKRNQITNEQKNDNSIKELKTHCPFCGKRLDN